VSPTVANGYIQRQKRRRAVSAFAALLATPSAGTVALPSWGHFALVSDAGSAASPAALTLADGREIGTPALTAGQRWHVGKLEAQSVALTGGFDLYLDVGLGQFKKVGEG
jgi:hypothetical protein